MRVGRKRITIDRKILQNLYQDQALTKMEIARKLGISISTIQRLLKEYSIAKPDRPINKKKKLTARDKIVKSWLVDNYINKELSTYKCAELIGCGAREIGRFLNEYDIPTRISLPKEHVFIGGIEYKECGHCKELLSLSEYHCASHKPDGLSSICKNCTSQKSKDYDREKHRIRKQRRKAKQKELKSTLTPEEWNECLLFFDNSCAYCGLHEEITQDHIIPLSKNGNYEKNNIVPACKSCNSSKNNRDMDDWYKGSECFNQDRLCKIYNWIDQQEVRCV